MSRKEGKHVVHASWHLPHLETTSVSIRSPLEWLSQLVKCCFCVSLHCQTWKNCQHQALKKKHNLSQKNEAAKKNIVNKNRNGANEQQVWMRMGLETSPELPTLGFAQIIVDAPLRGGSILSSAIGRPKGRLEVTGRPQKGDGSCFVSNVCLKDSQERRSRFLKSWIGSSFGSIGREETPLFGGKIFPYSAILFHFWRWPSLLLCSLRAICSRQPGFTVVGLVQ